MALVGRAVKVDTVPATGEPNLSAKTVLAHKLISGELVLLGVAKAREAGITDGVFSVCSIVVSPEGVSCCHTETLWESSVLGELFIGSSSARVVDGQSSTGNQGECSVGVLVVKVRSPVRGLIDIYRA